MLWTSRERLSSQLLMACPKFMNLFFYMESVRFVLILSQSCLFQLTKLGECGVSLPVGKRQAQNTRVKFIPQARMQEFRNLDGRGIRSNDNGNNYNICTQVPIFFFFKRKLSVGIESTTFQSLV